MASCTFYGNNSSLQSKTIKMQVASNEWQYDNTTQRFYCHFNQSAITADIYKYGNWTINREYNSGTKDAYLVALPESVFKSEVLTNGSVIYYTQLIDYAVGQGWVEITLTNSDYGYDQDPQGYLIAPEAMTFVMQITY